MSTPVSHNPPAAQPAPPLAFLLPGDESDREPAPSSDQLASFVSTQSLSDHIPLEDVAPFTGVYNIDGLLFIEIDGRTYEVVFDSENFRFNIVAPHMPDKNIDPSATQPESRKAALPDWHPRYLAANRKWGLFHADASIRGTAGPPRRLMTLPHRVDALLKAEDLLTIVETVERFLHTDSAQPTSVRPAHTLLSRLAAPHLSALNAATSNARPTQKSMGVILDAMLVSAQADRLARELLSALAWYGGEDGELTAPVIRRQLVWAALMLELDPPAQQQKGYVAGCDLEGPSNWGQTYKQRRSRLMTALSLKTPAPEWALCILAPAIPDFVVEDVDEDLRYGTAAWVNFIHGLSLANALDPDLAATLTFESLIQLPMSLSKSATPEELVLIAATRALPALTWAIANGVLPQNSEETFSSLEIAVAASALDDHLANAVLAAEGITREVPDRIQMADEKLHEMFGEDADRLKKRLMHPVDINDRITYSLKSPDIYSGAQFYLLDVFAAGQMIKGMDKFQPVTSNDQRAVNAAFARTAQALKGIDIPAMFEAKYQFFEAQVKRAYTFVINGLWAQLPAEDRTALKRGRVKIHTLRTATGKLAGMEDAEDRKRKRGRYGFVLECSYQDRTFFYELFPLMGIAVRRTRMSIPTKPEHSFPAVLPSFLEIVTGSVIDVDWEAYSTLAQPVAGKKSLVISETILEFAPPADRDDDMPMPLTSARLKDIATAVAENHLFFHPQDTYQRYRHQTASEYVATRYPTTLREMALIVPGLSCVNAMITDESPAATCTLDALTFGIPVLRLLRGMIRLALRAGKLAIAQTLPRFAWLSSSVITQSGYFHGAMRAASVMMPGALGKVLGARVFNLQAFQALAYRMRSYLVPHALTIRPVLYVSGIPTLLTPPQWRATSASDILAKVSGLENVPIREIPNAIAGRFGAHYLIDSGVAYGPRLIARRSAMTTMQRVNDQVGYPMSGRGAVRSPIASPSGTRLGASVESSSDVANVIKANNISATAEQINLIKNAMDDGAPLFVYDTTSGTKSLALHDVPDNIYLDAFTNTRVDVFRFYQHDVIKTWKVDPAHQANVMQVDPQLLATGRQVLVKERLNAVRAGITKGQYLPPIHVRARAGGFYPVVNGNHRLAVARDLKLETVPVLIVGE